VYALARTTTPAMLDAHFHSAFPDVHCAVHFKKPAMGSAVMRFVNAEQAEQGIAFLDQSILDGRVIRCRLDNNKKRLLANATNSIIKVVPTNVNVPIIADSSSAVTSTNGRPIFVCSQNSETNKIFVSSLSWSTTSESLAAAFASAGTVVSCVILSSKKGRSFGQGIVEFSDATGAHNAIANFHNKYELHGRVMTVRTYYAV
jgi:RNA recognition motif-containing protein